MAVDLGAQGSFVANQARIYAIDPAARSRMSGQLFLIAYPGAAACSAVIATFWGRWGVGRHLRVCAQPRGSGSDHRAPQLVAGAGLIPSGLNCLIRARMSRSSQPTRSDLAC